MNTLTLTRRCLTCSRSRTTSLARLRTRAGVKRSEERFILTVSLKGGEHTVNTRESHVKGARLNSNGDKEENPMNTKIAV